MDQPDTPAKLGVKIERPSVEKIGFVYFFLFVVSLLLISITVWLIVLEWTGTPLPAFLRLPIA